MGAAAVAVAPLGYAGAPSVITTPEPVQPQHASHYLWAVLIARIDEVLPLLYSMCGEQMKLVALITHSADIRQILGHIGVESEPPRISHACGPPQWDDFDDAPGGGDAKIDPDWDLAAQPAPDCKVDQRIN